MSKECPWAEYGVSPLDGEDTLICKNPGQPFVKDEWVKISQTEYRRLLEIKKKFLEIEKKFKEWTKLHDPRPVVVESGTSGVRIIDGMFIGMDRRWYTVIPDCPPDVIFMYPKMV